MIWLLSAGCTINNIINLQTSVGLLSRLHNVFDLKMSINMIFIFFSNQNKNFHVYCKTYSDSFFHWRDIWFSYRRTKKLHFALLVVFFMHFWFNPPIWQKLFHFHVGFSSFNLRKHRNKYFLSVLNQEGSGNSTVAHKPPLLYAWNWLSKLTLSPLSISFRFPLY